MGPAVANREVVRLEDVRAHRPDHDVSDTGVMAVLSQLTVCSKNCDRDINSGGALEAELEAAERADELLAAGDMGGRGVWLRVVEVVKELSESGPAPAGTVH